MASSPFKPFPPANLIIQKADVSRRQKAHLDRMDKILRHSSLQELWVVAYLVFHLRILSVREFEHSRELFNIVHHCRTIYAPSH